MKCPSKYNEQQHINQDTLTSLTY